MASPASRFIAVVAAFAGGDEATGSTLIDSDPDPRAVLAAGGHRFAEALPVLARCTRCGEVDKAGYLATEGLSLARREAGLS
jgi:hypothetical protein